MIKLLSRYLKPYTWQIILLFLFQFTQAFLNLYLPNLQAEVVDKGIVTGNQNEIYHLSTIMIIVALIQGIANITVVIICSHFATHIAYEVRRDFFNTVGNLHQQDIDHYTVGSLITRSTNDVYQIQRTLFQVCRFVLQAPIMFIGGLIMALQQNKTLTWSLVIILPIIAIIISIIFSKIGPLFKKLQHELDRINLSTREQITGLRIIRSFVKEKSEAEKFQGINHDTTVVIQRTGFLMGIIGPIMWFVTSLFNIVVMWFGGHLIESGNMQIGALQAFIQYIMIVLSGFMMAAMMSVTVPRASVASKRLLEVIHQTTTYASDAKASLDTATFTEAIEFNDVTFTYPGSTVPALDHVSFTVHPGETVALVGITGAGKSTILRLLQRIYEVTDGSITIDHHPLKDFTSQSLRALFGFVPQKAQLFTGTVRSNLKFGNSTATDDDMWEALQTAQAADFIHSTPQQLDAPVTENGDNFSGGQKQRLCIARALMKKPTIYILDDSFSALDMETDKRLREALHTTMRTQSTFLMVSQRIATIQDADKIIVLEKGKIVGKGTHDQLMQTCDHYQQIADLQQQVL